MTKDEVIACLKEHLSGLEVETRFVAVDDIVRCILYRKGKYCDIVVLLEPRCDKSIWIIPDKGNAYFVTQEITPQSLWVAVDSALSTF